MHEYLGVAIIVLGAVLQIMSWRYKRPYPAFWVSKPIWYYLYPKGVVLAVAGVWLVLGGMALYFKG